MKSLAIALLIASMATAHEDPTAAPFENKALEFSAEKKIDPIAAVSSGTDAATRKMFDFLSWYSDGYYNEYYRFKAEVEADKGDWKHAAKLFEIASRFGDKYSQHRLSLLYWYGVGVEKDQVAAYVWADIAAERGYRPLLLVREKMWQALAPEQRAAVAERGRKLYAVYGDAVALPKFRGLIARQRARHFVMLRIMPHERDPRFNANQYLAVEGQNWGKDVVVKVGDIEQDKPQQAKHAEQQQPKDGPR